MRFQILCLPAVPAFAMPLNEAVIRVPATGISISSARRSLYGRKKGLLNVKSGAADRRLNGTGR
ncbi:hypothetical protein JXA40_02350 [bacterium]|nr:hypothetical protein [candidate division CSSED10-310 bacterium]